MNQTYVLCFVVLRYAEYHGTRRFLHSVTS
jgi:hypothetical protein